MCASDVVICFHFTIFVVLETTINQIHQPFNCCDLLSFYYLCRTGNNRNSLRVLGFTVVICFHFTIFVVLETTSTTLSKLGSSCDLLSFYYLCRTGNNNSLTNNSRPIVVICFHFTIFVVLETTLSITISNASSCDLLSFYYLCRTGNNRNTKKKMQ